MTTTNHPPYSLPETSTLQIPRTQLVVPDLLKSQLTVDLSLAQKRFEAYRYSNESLAEFLSFVKEHPQLREKTI